MQISDQIIEITQIPWTFFISEFTETFRDFTNSLKMKASFPYVSSNTAVSSMCNSFYNSWTTNPVSKKTTFNKIITNFGRHLDDTCSENTVQASLSYMQTKQHFIGNIIYQPLCKWNGNHDSSTPSNKSFILCWRSKTTDRLFGTSMDVWQLHSWNKLFYIFIQQIHWQFVLQIKSENCTRRAQTSTQTEGP